MSSEKKIMLKQEIELDQDLYTDNIIYISWDLVNCDLLKGIES